MVNVVIVEDGSVGVPTQAPLAAATTVAANT